ncbi:MAG TPA: 4-alpha-glucanotransferase [Actinomycetes bacterium]|nr:4-alpha-glucanotransferase [Actinomycetes bacterium]
MMLDELRRAAAARGIATSFTDAGGRHYEVAEGTLRAVLDAMGPQAEPADWPPIVVARTGRSPRSTGAPLAPSGGDEPYPPPAGPLRGPPYPSGWRPPVGEPAEVVLESGERRPLPADLPGDLEPGWHRVVGRGGTTVLVVAPDRCHLPPLLEQGGRAWGWAAQLYAVRSRASWGIGDLGDLAGLLATTGRLGAGFALLNPLHAASPDESSPYNPSSRMFRNPLYLRVGAVPELAALTPGERDRVEELDRRGLGLLDHDRIDRAAVYRLKDEALRLAHGATARLPGRRAGLAAYRAATDNLEQFATFCALQRVHGKNWRDWPAAYRHPARAEVAAFGERHRDEVDYHAWLQWLLDQQLAAVPSTPDGLGVLNDLAIGFAPDGFDAWTFQDDLAPGMTVGAPPDPLGPHGQDWGLPAFVPDRLAAGAYGPFAQTIRAGMAHAAGLRIDHVMGLFRLFWIPEGAEPAQGTYVRYPADDLLGILALESLRAGALVVGEDLGTVEQGVRERLAAEGVLSCRLAWFEHEADGRRRRAADYPRLALAATTTHDLPTVAGFFSGSDLDHLCDIGVATAGGDEQANQEEQRASLCRLLEDEGLLDAGEREVGAIVAALYGFLTRTPAMLVAATLEDAVQARDRPNVPGTIDQRPNWSLPLPVKLDDLATDPRVRRLAAILSNGMKGSTSRS